MTEAQTSAPAYPRHWEADVLLRDGGSAHLRPASPADAVPSLPSTLLPQVGSVFSFTFGTLANIVFVLFVTLFFAANPKLYLGGLIRLFPPKRRARARVVIDQVGATLHALLRLSVLIRDDLPTLGWPMRPIVSDCLTGADDDDDEASAPEAPGVECRRKPLMSSMRGLVDDPDADHGLVHEGPIRDFTC